MGTPALGATLPAAVLGMRQGARASAPTRRRGLPIAVTLAIASSTAAIRHYRLAATAGFYGVALSLALVGAYKLFEYSVETLEHRIPQRMLPIVQSMLTEVAGIGFIGLLLQVLHATKISGWLGRLSQWQFGDSHLLMHLFERLHMSFFFVALVYFGSCALVILMVVRRFRFWGIRCRREALLAALAEPDRRDARSLKVLGRRALWEKEILRKADRISKRGFKPVQEVLKEYPDWSDEYLCIRQRFVQQASSDGVPISTSFSLWPYMEEVAAENLKRLVVLNPCQLAVFWLPPVSVGTAILIYVLDMSTDLHMAGALFRVSWYFYPLIVLNVFMLLWGCCSVLKLAWIKYMVTPCRSPFSEQELVARYSVVPFRVTWLERSILKLLCRITGLPVAFKTSNKQEELFGIPGGSGQRFYLEGIKWLMYFAVSSVVFCSEVVFRNASLIARVGVANVPPGTVPEAALLGVVVLMNLTTVALTPHAFTLHCWATSVEEMRRESVLAKVLSSQRSKRFRTTLVSLATLTFNLELASRAGQPGKRSEADVESQWQHLLARVQEDSSLLDMLFDLRVLFDNQDSDGNQVLSIDEVEKVAELLGYQVQSGSQQLDNFFVYMDADSTDTVNFKEFATAILDAPFARGKNLRPTRWSGEALARAHRQVFAVFDKDGNGSIEFEEFVGLLGQVGFETVGAEQLFQDVSGSPLRVISATQFRDYLDKCMHDTLGDPSFEVGMAQ